MQMLREWNKSQLITRHIWSELTCPYTSKSPTVHQNPHKFIKRTLFYKQDTIIKLLGKSGDYLSMIRCCWSGLWFSNNFLSSDLSHFVLFAVALKLAVVPFLLEELDVVVLAVELSFMCNIVWWAYGATSMGAFEAASMVWCPINRNLLDWVNGLVATKTFFSGAPEHIWDCLSILINLSFRSQDFWCSFKTLVQAASALEELIIVRPAI